MSGSLRVALMIPCYIDMFYPQVGVATLELLEKLGVEVDYPFDQTCCGQPMANSGASPQAKATEELFVRNFTGYEHIVAPSGSCVHHIRNKFTAAEDTPQRRHASSHVWDLPEFLCDVLKVQQSAMGNDKLARIGATGARYIVSPDMSCLMHLQGCAHRNREDFHFLHLAQVLNGGAE
jgi:Fe-S oxidoreductase